MISTRIFSARDIPEDAIVIHAAGTAELMAPEEEQKLMDGRQLGEIWPQLVYATHPDYGSEFSNMHVTPSTFLPVDRTRFMIVKCRSVSSFEKWGPNANGDSFPAEELSKSHQTLIGKGFYIEHASFNPQNAIGIIAHSQWNAPEQFVTTVSLIDKMRFPGEADEIRRRLGNKSAGVSIGCIAGTAQCSVCGNIATKRHELCAHMDRSNPFCVKGKRLSNGHLAHDICRNLTFYELSYTKAPADRDALGLMLSGSDRRFGQDEKPKGAAEPVTAPQVMNEAAIEKMISNAVNATIKSRVHKLIKAEIERQIGPLLREYQVEIKPDIKEGVADKKQEVQQVV